MQIDRQQLTAFYHVLHEGSFEKAAAALNLTPSAVSQRIKAIEERLGCILIVRDTPCRPTGEGERLYRHAEQLELLEAELDADFEAGVIGPRKFISLAVNADSLATWFMPAMAEFSATAGFQIEILTEDEGHASQWLKNGRVMGAVTAHARPVQGCDSEFLGAIRYYALASPAFKDRFFPQGAAHAGFARAPLLASNARDQLQHRFASLFKGTTKCDPPCHYFPSPQALVDAAASGLGWCVAPENMADAALKTGRLVRLSSRSMDVALYWQCWRLKSDTLLTLNKAIRKAAKNNLRPLKG